MIKKTFNVLKGESYKEIVGEILKTSFQVILLEGSLGAGKTTFVIDFVKILNDQALEEKDFDSVGVMSPTFSIINEYKLSSLSVMHADFYRIKENSFDLEEILENIEENDFSLIEWSEKIPLLKESLESFIQVSINEREDGSREVCLKFWS